MQSKIKILENMIRKIVREEYKRITHGSEEIHRLNNDSIREFASRYKGSDNDVFFTNDGYAHVTDRMDNIISHGSDSGKSMNLRNVKIVYCGLEDDFYEPADFGKLLKSVYMGKKSKIKSANF